MIKSLFPDCKPGLPAHLTLSYDSFTDKPVDRGTIYTGTILNTNTVEEFKAKDFSGILKSAGEKVQHESFTPCIVSVSRSCPI